MKLPRIRIADSGHYVVHEAYVASLESREQHLAAALCDALEMFKCTQRPTEYPPDHWSNRAMRLLANDQAQARRPGE